MTDNLTMPEFLEDDVIELHARRIHDFDEDLWLETDKNREFLREYLTWVDNTNSVEDCHSATEMFIDEWNNARNYAYCIVLKSSKKAIGSIDIHSINHSNMNGDIGYWLAKEYNGQGLMSRAVKLIENQAFANGFHRLTITVEKENIPSTNVAKRNNYVFEGTHKDKLYKYGKFYDCLTFAKVR